MKLNTNKKKEGNIECAHMFVHKEPTKSPYDLLQTTNPAKSRTQNGNGIVFHPKWQSEKKLQQQQHTKIVCTISLLSIMYSKMSFRVILC